MKPSPAGVSGVMAKGVAPWLAGFALSSSMRELLKWGAAALMVLDHVNAYAWAWGHPWLYALGRIAFPIFGFVFAYNLAEQPTAARCARALRRMVVFGLLAQPFSMLLRHHVMAPTAEWWVLNVLFTLAAAVLLIWLTLATRNAWALLAAAIAFLFVGALVEFHWAGLLYVLASFLLCRARSTAALMLWLLSFGGLWIESGAPWGCAAIPLLVVAAAAAKRQLPATRAPWWLWYAFYPMHLLLLWFAIMG